MEAWFPAEALSIYYLDISCMMKKYLYGTIFLSYVAQL